jgi:hypothetical protein
VYPRAATVLTQIGKPRRVKVAPGRTAATSVTPPPPPPLAPATPTYDYSTDPILGNEKTAAGSEYEGTMHGIDARRRLALLGFGSRDLAMKTLGLGADDPFIQSIDENGDTGTGALERLAHAYKENQRNKTLEENHNNLFYSSAHTKALADLAYNNSQAIGEATRGIGGILEGLTEEGTTAETRKTNRISTGEQGAMGRAIDFNLQYPQSASAPAAMPPLSQLAASVKPKKKPAAQKILSVHGGFG